MSNYRYADDDDPSPKPVHPGELRRMALAKIPKRLLFH
jgi:hypothetical protein